MKELSIEQKAKAYDEAIERAKVFKEHLLEINDKGYADEMDYIFPELAESEDEKIRKAMIKYFTNGKEYLSLTPYSREDYIAWLEKQGEHAKFRDSIQVGDKVTRNEDGVLVNLSQLNRVAKKDEKQVEQKPAWSEEDEWCLEQINFLIRNSYSADDKVERLSNWLKSFKDRYSWKPSKEMLEALYRVIPENTMEISEDEMLLDKLYQGLKYGKVLSKK